MSNNLLPFNASSTLGEMVDIAKQWNAASIKMVFSDEQNNPTGAVVVIHGEDTSRILKAIEAVQAEIDREVEAEEKEEELAQIRANNPAVNDPHYDADGNLIEWCIDHDAEVITDGQCFECLRGDRTL